MAPSSSDCESKFEACSVLIAVPSPETDGTSEKMAEYSRKARQAEVFESTAAPNAGWGPSAENLNARGNEGEAKICDLPNKPDHRDGRVFLDALHIVVAKRQTLSAFPTTSVQIPALLVAGTRYVMLGGKVREGK